MNNMCIPGNLSKAEFPWLRVTSAALSFLQHFHYRWLHLTQRENIIFRLGLELRKEKEQNSS